VERWEEEEAQQEWVLTSLRGDVLVFEEDGTPIDLLHQLPTQGQRGTLRVLVGRHQLPMRLFFERVSEEVAEHRRQKLKRENQQRGQALSPRVKALAGWSIAVTTVPETVLCWQEAIVLLRLRWHMELLFKRWKDDGQLDVWRSTTPNRILCEMVATLLGLLIQQWMLVVRCWHDPHRSLGKAARAFRRQIALLSTALVGEWNLNEAGARILTVVGASARLTMRGDAPGTSQMLVTGTNHWSSKPMRPWRSSRKKRQWQPPNRKKPCRS